MRFKTDENLPEEFALALREAGWDALTVVEQRLGGSSDPRVAEICTAESRTLITLDLGFGNIKAYPPREHAGIIVLRPARQDKLSVLELAGRLIEALKQREIGRELWVVDEQKVRIRS
jgi:predicted nuclease of predicted toxin-antitoxin system